MNYIERKRKQHENYEIRIKKYKEDPISISKENIKVPKLSPSRSNIKKANVVF